MGKMSPFLFLIFQLAQALFCLKNFPPFHQTLFRCSISSSLFILLSFRFTSLICLTFTLNEQICIIFNSIHFLPAGSIPWGHVPLLPARQCHLGHLWRLRHRRQCAATEIYSSANSIIFRFWVPRSVKRSALGSQPVLP